MRYASIGPFKVERELGRGGMGVVFLAEDSRLGRKVAIKVLPDHLAGDPDRLARFNREARTLASLNHPNVAQIFGVEEQEGRKHLVLEYVEGPTLAERLKRGPIALDEALAIAMGIAAGLEAAHEAGIVHRDLKPANIKITPEGKVKVLDFGLARTHDEAASSAGPLASPDSPTVSVRTTPVQHSPTIPGAILGTAAYMSPEQARGRRVDRRTDVWSFGVILYECLTGISPFAGETATDSIGAVLHKPIDLSRLPPETPARLRDLLSRVLERDREKRLRDMGDVMLEIERVRLEGPGGGAAARGEGAGWVLVVVSIIACLGGIGVAVWALLRPVPAGSVASAAVADRALKVSLTQVTDVVGNEAQPAISPDGASIVYTVPRASGCDLFSIRIGGLNTTNLTADSPTDDTQPAFAPDGQSIAFRSERDGGGIYVMGATGESPRRLTREGFNPDWSPDGRAIVFASEGIVDPLSRLTVSRLSIVDVATGTISVVFAGDAVQPSWSPSGARIAYWGTGLNGQRDVYTIPAAGGAPVAVTNDSPLDWSPRWSPDGRHLYFISDRGGSHDIWRIPIDEATGRTTGSPEAVTRAPGATILFLSVARHHHRIAFMTGSLSTQIMRLDIDPGAGTGRGSPRPLILTTTSNTAGAVSPDGKRVAYSGRRGNNEDLYVVNADGTGRRRLTNDAARDRGPIWTPDGRSLLFYSDRGGVYQIWTIHADGSGLKRITDEPDGAIVPVLSRDGQRLAYASRVGRFTILRLDQSSVGREVVPVPEGYSVAPLHWSPEGDRLLVELSEGENEPVGLGLFDPSTNTIESLKVSAMVRHAAFLPDGRRVVLLTTTGLEVFDLGDSSRSPIWTFERRLDFVSDIQVAPDGSWVTFTAPVSEMDVWIADVEEGGTAPR